MNKQTQAFDETPSVDGPDYVALVIEWNEDAEDLEQEVTRPTRTSAVSAPARHPFDALIAGAGAVGLFLLARWGIHRLRSAF